MIDVVLVQRSPFDTDPHFPLADGPIAPLDAATFLTPLPRPRLVDLVASASGELAGHHAALDQAHATITDNSQPTLITAASTSALDPAAAAHGSHAGAFDQADPVSVIATTNSHGAIINANQHSYDQEPPPDLAPHDPGEPPRHGGDGSDGGRV